MGGKGRLNKVRNIFFAGSNCYMPGRLCLGVRSDKVKHKVQFRVGRAYRGGLHVAVCAIPARQKNRQSRKSSLMFPLISFHYFSLKPPQLCARS